MKKQLQNQERGMHLIMSYGPGLLCAKKERGACMVFNERVVSVRSYREEQGALRSGPSPLWRSHFEPPPTPIALHYDQEWEVDHCCRNPSHHNR